METSISGGIGNQLPVQQRTLNFLSSGRSSSIAPSVDFNRRSVFPLVKSELLRDGDKHWRIRRLEPPLPGGHGRVV